jgi:hypothetical protein
MSSENNIYSLLFSPGTPTRRCSKLFLDHLLDLVFVLSEPVVEVHVAFVTQKIVKALGVQMPLILRH